VIEGKDLDVLVEKAIGRHIKKDIEMISKTLYTNIEKYAFLLDGDILKTQKMLVEAAFVTDNHLVDKKKTSDVDDVVHFNMEVLLKHISIEKKQEIYNSIFNEFVNKVSVSDLQKVQMKEE